MGGIEVFALNVNTGEGETLPGCFFWMFWNTNLSKSLAERQGSRVSLDGGAEPLYRLLGCFVLYKQLSIEQRGFDFVYVFALCVSSCHCSC